MKNFLKNTKAFFIALGITVRKTVNKVFTRDLRIRLRKVGWMLGSVLGVFARIVLIMALIILLTGTFIGVFGALYVTRYLDVDTDIDLEQISLDLTSHIYAADPDRPGEWVVIQELSGGENRVWVEYKDIPRDLVDAVVTIEDHRFWTHDGVDWKRTVGAFANLFLPGGKQFGGSTLTQQMIKNATGENEVTVARKLQEIFQALAFEKKYPGQAGKEMILELYLNLIPLGNGCYGVLTAADKYFGKTLDELTLAECAVLAGITNNPSLYDPYSRPKNIKRRQEVILYEMLDKQIIDRHTYNLAKYQPLDYSRKSSSGGGNMRSWYVDQVITDATNDLVEAWGVSRQLASRYIFSGGYNIYACVDLKIQAAMDSIWADPDCWPSTPDAEPPESAMMVVDHTTGDIKALIGGREKTGNLEFNLSTMARRQPGSSIKPLTVYSPAFELGVITPYTPIDDMPSRDMNGRGWPRNTPARYDGRMSVLAGVTQSKNAVAVQVLERVGYPKAFSIAFEKFGLVSLVESKPVGKEIKTDIGPASLALGGLTDGVTVKEMTGAYSAIANNGVRNETRTYTHITDADDAVIFENRPEQVLAIKEKTAYYMRTCLFNAVNGSGGTGGRARLSNMPTAGKTGTTSDNKDRWFSGFTPYYTAVCWFGYTIPRDMTYYTSNPAVHMWKQVMEKAHEDLERREFEQPDGLVQYAYCMDSGLPPGDACRLDPRGNRAASGYLDKDDVPRAKCNVHQECLVCTASGHLATPYCPEEVTKTISLMYMPNRWSPIAGLSLYDEQFTIRYWDQQRQDPPEGLFPVSNYYADGKPPYNTFCELHTSEYIPPITEEPPPDGEQPYDPAEPGDPDEPGEPGDVSPAPPDASEPPSPDVPDFGDLWASPSPEG